VYLTCPGTALKGESKKRWQLSFKPHQQGTITMTERNPKVSFGLPVFNGEKYLDEAIQSILSQTFTDFELIISDNASTDRTEEICKEYLSQDPRIRYHRNETNIGGSRNQNLTIELARGEYFHIGAYDDLLAPNLLSKCVEVLDKNPSVILCYTFLFKIDDSGKMTGKLEPDVMATSTNPIDRFHDLLKGHPVDFLYGLIRTDTLRKTELEPSYPQSDSVFACELALQGQFYRIPEYLYFRRIHEEACTSLDLYGKLLWSQNIQTAPRWAPTFLSEYYLLLGVFRLEASHFLRIIYRAYLTPKERFFCLFYALIWLLKKYFPWRLKALIKERLPEKTLA
jgi:glycosyltransferase involved in cell wall biosynthesis